MFTDVELLEETIEALKASPYPAGTLHTFAVKANPLGPFLEVMQAHGLGAEAASLGELQQALAAGFPPDRIVFDSPCKTVSELRFALKSGVRLNLDNFQEVERVELLMQSNPEWLRAPARRPPRRSTLGGGGEALLQATARLQLQQQRSEPLAALISGVDASAGGGPVEDDDGEQPPIIGLRINPQVGEGSIAALSTAGLVSKFGIPLLEAREEVLAAFGRHPWLNALHLHVGSQGVPLELTVEGVAAVWGLLEEIEALHGPGRVRVLDIGGGLPVQYASDDLSWLLGSGHPLSGAAGPEAAAAAAEPAAPREPMFHTFCRLLRERLPQLYAAPTGAAEPAAPRVQVVTECGRCLVANSTFAASRIEYTKSCGGRQILVSGLGADLMLRACLLPATWPARVQLHDSTGRPLHPLPAAAAGQPAQQQQQLLPTDVVGPLCFQGDRLAEALPLPLARPGYFVVAPDVGAYTLSMYSRYNSRTSPPVWAFWLSPQQLTGGSPPAPGATDDVLGVSMPIDVEGSIGSSSSMGMCARGSGYRIALQLLRRGDDVEDVLSFWNQI